MIPDFSNLQLRTKPVTEKKKRKEKKPRFSAKETVRVEDEWHRWWLTAQLHGRRYDMTPL
jgi:hypothetical protein